MNLAPVDLAQHNGVLTRAIVYRSSDVGVVPYRKIIAIVPGTAVKGVDPPTTGDMVITIATSEVVFPVTAIETIVV